MRRADSKTLSIQLAPAQYAAVQAEVARLNTDLSRYVRRLLAENVPGFQDDIPPRGTYDRRRQFVGLCIGDEDIVEADLPDGGFAQAWLEGWHRDDAGEEVPAVYNLSTNDETPHQFETLKELLDAMAEVAPFALWRVEGED